MGCGASAGTAVLPLPAAEQRQRQDQTGAKAGVRGDSAASKGTADSGVVMENREGPPLPGAVPMKLPPLTSETVRESQAAAAAADGVQQQERLKSSQILEELLNDGIISAGQSGEAYGITPEGREEVRQRPPARLESLRVGKAQGVHHQDDVDRKMKRAEEWRKSREDELRTRLRSKSARARHAAAVCGTEEEDDATFDPVEPLSLAPDPALPPPPPHAQVRGEAAEGTEGLREAGGGGVEHRPEAGGANPEGEGGRKSRGDGEESEEEEEEEESTQVEELKAGELLSASEELESDSTFQQAENKEEAI